MWNHLSAKKPEDQQVVMVKMKNEDTETVPSHALAKYHLCEDAGPGYYFEPEGVVDEGGNNWMSLIDTVVAWVNIDGIIK